MSQNRHEIPQLDRSIALQCSNLYRHLTFLPSRLEKGRIRDEGDALLINSGYPTDTFNKATHFLLPPDGAALDAEGGDNPGDEPAALFDINSYLEQVEEFFGGLPFTWWLGPDASPENLGDILEKHGYSLQEEETGMHLDLTAWDNPAPMSADLDIHWVEHREQLEDYAMLMAANWSPPDPSVMAAYREAADALLMPGAFIHFAVGYHAGRPVCGVEYWRGPGRMIGVYGLVTLEAWRGKGFATALLRAGLRHWKQEGMTEATLQASPDGLGIYEKMGFKAYGMWREYGKAL